MLKRLLASSSTAVTVASSNPSIPFDPSAHPDVSPPFPTFEASLDRQRPGFETGSIRPLWQGRPAPAIGAGSVGSRFVLRSLRAIFPQRPSGLPDGGAGAGALPERHRRLDRPPERDVLPQGERVIWPLGRGPLRLSGGSRPRRSPWGAELTAIRSATVSAIIGPLSRRRRSSDRVELPER